MDLGGLPIPDTRPVFLAALALHLLAAGTAVLAGVAATTAPKRPGRHPRAGAIYLWAVTAVLGTALVLGTMRWREDRLLVGLALVTAGLAWTGRAVRRRGRPGWPLRHGLAMASSYTVLFIGFYVDNGPHLPGWDRLPPPAYWLLPAAVATPLTWRALVRHRDVG